MCELLFKYLLSRGGRKHGPQVQMSAARLPPVPYSHTGVFLGVGSKACELYVYVLG